MDERVKQCMNKSVKKYIEFYNLIKIPHGRLDQTEYPYYDGSVYYIDTYGMIYRITITNIYSASGRGAYYDIQLK